MIKKSLKKIITKYLSESNNTLKNELLYEIIAQSNNVISKLNLLNDKEAQILLRLKYKELINTNKNFLSFEDVAFRKYSQFGEDGILLYLFSILGTSTKKLVDIGAGVGVNSNGANLIINHGWDGLFIDGNINNVKYGESFFAKHGDTFLWPPKFKCAWITAENIDSLISNAGFEGEIDLLSIDIDGNDYWVLKAIECISPRIIVCETSNLVPHDIAITIPYNADFRYEIPDYHGASLLAMTKLANKKGYRLVGTNRYGFNAFFIRNDIGKGIVPEVSVESCLQDSYSKHAVLERWPKVKDLEWVEV